MIIKDADKSADLVVFIELLINKLFNLGHNNIKDDFILYQI